MSLSVNQIVIAISHIIRKIDECKQFVFPKLFEWLIGDIKVKKIMKFFLICILCIYC